MNLLKTRKLWTSAAVAAAAAGLTCAVMAQSGATPVSGTIYGAFDYAFEGTGAWVGNALFEFDGAPVAAATFADRNTSFGQRKNGAIYGTETVSLTFADGGKLELPCRFDGTVGSTPNLYTLHEVCTVGGGTGRYAHASGQLVIHGPFLFPDPGTTPGTPLWIAEIHGAISGIE